jgi:hypothetical protein
MLSFTVQQYRIDLSDATSNYKDNLNDVEYLYLGPKDIEPTSVQSIRLYENEELLRQIFLGARGGGTGVWKDTALVNGDQLVSCCSDSVFCLSIPELELLWECQADPATCFAIHLYQQDYIVHGELEITRLDSKGNIVWQYGGVDIFVTLTGDSSIILNENHIAATDFEYSKYKIDYEGHTISYEKLK